MLTLRCIVRYRLKNDGAYRTKWRVRYSLAKLPPRVMKQVRDYGNKVFRALQLRDYARLDFRLTDEGRLVFIEANPNSDLTPNTLGRNLCFVGIDYHNLIPHIVETARKLEGLTRHASTHAAGVVIADINERSGSLVAREIKASRGSSLSGKAMRMRPCGMTAGRSLAL